MRDNGPLNGKEIVLRDDQLIVSRTDLQGRIVYANADFIEINGFSEDELIGQPQNIIRAPGMPAEVFADLWTDLKAGRPWIGVIQNRCRNGDSYWVMTHVSPVWEKGEVVGYLSMRRKASAAQIAEAESNYAAMREQRLDGRVFRHGRVVADGYAAKVADALARIPILYRFLLFSLVAALIVLGGMTRYISAELTRELDEDARSRLRHDVQLVASALSTRIEAGRKETIDHARSLSERVAVLLDQHPGEMRTAIEALAGPRKGEKTSVIDELMRDLNGIGTVFVLARRVSGAWSLH